MSKVIISVKDLVKKYGTFQAVKSISFDVFEGEIFGLLGPNGAGKSTTLEIIETLRSKTSGTVTVDGYDLEKDPSAIKKIIGVQLQTSGFYPGLNLIELIKLFGGLYNRSVNPMELLKKVNLVPVTLLLLPFKDLLQITLPKARRAQLISPMMK